MGPSEAAIVAGLVILESSNDVSAAASGNSSETARVSVFGQFLQQH